ncbi:hypothetical protein AAG906_033042 [Vitis piasezkii]
MGGLTIPCKENPFSLQKYVVESEGVQRLGQELYLFRGLQGQKTGNGGVQQVGSHGRDLLEAKLTEETEIKEGVVNAFQYILSVKRDWRPSISGLPFSSLDSVEAGLLEEAFSEEEVQIVVSSLKICG